MQKPFAYSPVNANAGDCSLSRWELSVVALVGAIMLFMISYALVTTPYDRGGSTSLAVNEFSSVPLP